MHSKHAPAKEGQRSRAVVQHKFVNAADTKFRDKNARRVQKT